MTDLSKATVLIDGEYMGNHIRLTTKSGIDITYPMPLTFMLGWDDERGQNECVYLRVKRDDSEYTNYVFNPDTIGGLAILEAVNPPREYLQRVINRRKAKPYKQLN